MNRLNNISSQIEQMSTVAIKNKINANTIQYTLKNKLNVINEDFAEYFQNQEFFMLKQENNEQLNIFINSQNPKVFSAGGDVKDMFYQAQKDNLNNFQNILKVRFNFEYNFSKLVDQNKNLNIIYDLAGLTIGGAYIFTAVTSKNKIATPSTCIYFPEVRNGVLMPQLQYFQQMQNNYGLFLALTGYKINGQEAVQIGLCDYYSKNQQFTVEQFLQKDQFKELFQNSQQLGNYQYHEYIKQIFIDTDDFSEFWGNLEYIVTIKDLKNQGLVKFAKECKRLMLDGSPVSLRVNFRLFWELRNRRNNNQQQGIQENNLQNFKYSAEREFLCNTNMVRFASQDFMEGLNTVLFEKNRKPEFMFKHPLDVTERLLNKILQTELEQNNIQLNI